MTETHRNDNPNGFITEREVDGERRSIRHYNDGRVSSRNSSREGRISSRPTSRASFTRSRVNSQTTSRSASRSTRRASSESGVGLVELFFEMDELDMPEHHRLLESEAPPDLSNTNREIKSLASQTVVPTSSPDLLSSGTAKESHVLSRVAKIENQIKKLGKKPSVDIAKDEEY